MKTDFSEEKFLNLIGGFMKSFILCLVLFISLFTTNSMADEGGLFGNGQIQNLTSSYIPVYSGPTRWVLLSPGHQTPPDVDFDFAQLSWTGVKVYSGFIMSISEDPNDPGNQLKFFANIWNPMVFYVAEDGSWNGFTANGELPGDNGPMQLCPGEQLFLGTLGGSGGGPVGP